MKNKVIFIKRRGSKIISEIQTFKAFVFSRCSVFWDSTLYRFDRFGIRFFEVFRGNPIKNAWFVGELQRRKQVLCDFFIQVV